MVLVIYKMQVRGDTVDSAVKRNRYEIDMCNGTVLDKLISFSIPLMLSGILQLLFNAVDIIVVGRFTGSQALAAVGSTTALINVFTNLFIGVSLGANVLAARFYASGQEKKMSETVHTAITFALTSSIDKCSGRALLCVRSGKEDVRDCTYSNYIRFDQRNCNGFCRFVLLKDRFGTYGYACRCN